VRAMRILAVLVVLVAAAPARAETRCYAGSDSSGSSTRRAIVERELDPDTHEIREHTWTDAAPTRDVTLTIHVANDNQTFSWKNARFDGTGKLTGEPWKWTAYHRAADTALGHISVDAKVDGTTLHISTRVTHDKQVIVSNELDAKAFDCKDLAAQRKALEGIAPDAKHACFEGETDGGSELVRHVIVEQFTEAKRVVLVTTGHDFEDRKILEVDGSKITARDTQRSWTGTGTISGKPGAWTGYEYKVVRDKIEIMMSGTLGGAVYSSKSEGEVSGVRVTMRTTAKAFDCAELDKRRAANR
jgi:hypothetical protein